MTLVSRKTAKSTNTYQRENTMTLTTFIEQNIENWVEITITTFGTVCPRTACYTTKLEELEISGEISNFIQNQKECRFNIGLTSYTIQIIPEPKDKWDNTFENANYVLYTQAILQELYIELPENISEIDFKIWLNDAFVDYSFLDKIILESYDDTQESTISVITCEKKLTPTQLRQLFKDFESYIKSFEN